MPAPHSAPTRTQTYAALCGQFQNPGWISEGSVQDRGEGQPRSRYEWTCKVQGQTLHVALSQEQYVWLQAAIANWRRLQRTLQEMQRLSRQELFATVAGPRRRKKLSQKVLGAS